MDNQNIERYVRQLMDAAEQQAFQEEMHQDETLKEEVEFYEDVAALVRKRKTLVDVQAELDAADFFAEETNVSTTDTEQEARVVPMPDRRFGRVRSLLAYAASALVLVVAGSTWWANSNYSNEVIASMDYDYIASGMAARNDGVKDPFGEGITAIEQQNYDVAVRFFEAVPSTDESYTEALLYLAYTQYKQANYQAAINTAKQVIANQPTTTNRFNADWLIVQAQLADGDTGTAFEQNLATIASNNNPDFQTQAQELQAKLNSFWRSLVF